MIQRTAAWVEAHPQTASDMTWQQALAGAVNRPEKLLEELGLNPALLPGAIAGDRLFQLRVPRPYLERIERGNPDDPLLRQVLPLDAETAVIPGYGDDPLDEANHMTRTGLIRKYRSRALLMITGHCAINCRYCFRRHFPYAEHRMPPDAREAALNKLQQSPEINEVIFSGGDPLAANDQLLAGWAEAVAAIPHVRRLRIHTRMPVVIPQRVDSQLLKWLTTTPLQTVVVLHINHAREIDEEVRAAACRLKTAGATLLNQSVILRGVNDDAGTLSELSEALFSAGILPYYLHGFDPVAGAAHFDVADDKAREIVSELRADLPGFLVPRLVREIPGQASKTPL